MLRKLVLHIALTAAVLLPSLAQAESSFITPVDATHQEMLSVLRQTYCGGYQTVLSKVQHLYAVATPEEIASAEGLYTSVLVPPVVAEAARKHTIGKGCLLVVRSQETDDGEAYVLLTPDGDQVFLPRDGQAFIAWSELGEMEYPFDSLEITDWTTEISQEKIDNMMVMAIVEPAE